MDTPFLKPDELERNQLAAPGIKSIIRLAAFLIICSSILVVVGFILRSYLAAVVSLMGWPLFIRLFRIVDSLPVTENDGQAEERFQYRRDKLLY